MLAASENGPRGTSVNVSIPLITPPPTDISAGPSGIHVLRPDADGASVTEVCLAVTPGANAPLTPMRWVASHLGGARSTPKTARLRRDAERPVSPPAGGFEQLPNSDQY